MATSYRLEVIKIKRESDELREILDSENLEKVAENEAILKQYPNHPHTLELLIESALEEGEPLPEAKTLGQSLQVA